MTNYGTWSQTQFCPTYAIGYNVKIQAPLKVGDNTALNEIKLICSDGSVLYSTSMPWGEYGQDVRCPQNVRLNGFKMKSEAPQGPFVDDTAANAVKMYCENNSEISNQYEGSWGRWGNMIKCPINTYICGFRARVDPPCGPLCDNTALNSFIFTCCA